MTFVCAKRNVKVNRLRRHETSLLSEKAAGGIQSACGFSGHVGRMPGSRFFAKTALHGKNLFTASDTSQILSFIVRHPF
jgi:hypothetical protein